MEHWVRQNLTSLIDPDFQRFTSRLLPGIQPILGVRLPLLRKLAREIIKKDWRTYLGEASDNSYEEIMLQGMVIGAAPTDPSETLSLVASFIPKINNWSVCDSFCSSLKVALHEPDLVWDFLSPYLSSNKEFEARFGVVMLLNYYIDSSHLHAVLSKLDEVSAQGYYARMAVAWAVSICYLHYPEQTLPYLQQNHLDNFTYNKSLQKIIESQRTNVSVKALMKSMKRP